MQQQTSSRERIEESRNRFRLDKESLAELTNEWAALLGDNSVKAGEQQRQIATVIKKKYGRNIMAESFSMKDYPAGKPKFLAPVDVEEGINLKDTKTLDMNQLFIKGAARPGDQLDMDGFDSLCHVKAASQEQLNMLPRKFRAQIKKITLSNNTEADENTVVVHRGTADKTLDLSSFTNLEQVDVFQYANADLAALKLPKSAEDVYVHNAYVPNLHIPSNVEVYTDKAKTADYAGSVKFYDFEFPTNHQEAEKLFDKRIRRDSWIVTDFPVDEQDKKENGGTGTFFDIVAEYPDLMSKAAAAYTKHVDFVSGKQVYDDYSSERFTNALYDATLKNGHKVIDESPEFALCYYDYAYQGLSFAVEHPNVVPAITKRWCQDVYEEKAVAADDVVIAGAFNPQHTFVACTILEEDGNFDALGQMGEFQKVAAQRYVENIPNMLNNGETEENVTRQAGKLVSRWNHLAGPAYQELLKYSRTEPQAKGYVDQEAFGEQNVKLAREQIAAGIRAKAEKFSGREGH